jgi:hypothetical protein
MVKGFSLEDPLETPKPETNLPFVPSPSLSPYEADALNAQAARLRGTRASEVAGLVPSGPRPKSTYRAARREAEKAEDDPLKSDFRNFLALIWRHLKLPVPSPVQLSLAWWLQHGPSRAVVLGFRGMAKSWITGAFILWNLYCDPSGKSWWSRPRLIARCKLCSGAWPSYDQCPSWRTCNQALSNAAVESNSTLALLVRINRRLFVALASPDRSRVRVPISSCLTTLRFLLTP